MSKGRRTEWFGVLPALAALSLGAVYGVGAITIYGQLKAEGVNGVQSMSLVPLEQILGQGIGRMAQQFGQALLLIGVLAISIAPAFILDREEEEKEATPPPRAIRWLTRILPIVSIGIVLLSPPMKEALVIAVSAIPGFLIAFFLTRFLRERREASVPVVATFGAATMMLVVIVLFNVAGAFIRPAPLPQVRLLASDGREVKGGLVEDTGSWLVVQDNRSVISMDSRYVERSFITFPPRPPEETSFEWLIDHSPL